MNTELAALLAWDTEFFGLRIAQVSHDRLSAGSLPELREWLREHRIACAYSRVPANSGSTLQLLQEFGFRYVDVRITLARPLDSLPPLKPSLCKVRPAVPHDLQHLQALAAKSHRNTRFFLDSRFPPERSESMYRIWMEKELSRQRGAVFTVESGGIANAYLTCNLGTGLSGEIGLFAVGPELQGKGCGQSLLHCALEWLANHGCHEVRVPTQVGNTAALRAYERAGFTIESAEVWLHWWSSPEDRSS